jgi:hypothetical protein
VTVLKYNQHNTVSTATDRELAHVKTDDELLKANWATTLKCFFIDENKFLFTICDAEKKYLRIYSFEYQGDINRFSCIHLQHFNLQKIKKNDFDFKGYELSYTICLAHKYLVLYQKYNKFVNFVDIETGAVKCKYEVSSSSVFQLSPS